MNALRQHREEVLYEVLDDCAKRGGLSRTTLSNVERGMRPKGLALPKLAAAYKLTIPELKRMLGLPVGLGETATEAMPKEGAA